MENNIGMVGLTCLRDNKDYPFEHCLGVCPNKCMSLPLLRAIIKESFVQDKRYSVTSICNPPQMLYLKRHKQYYVTPESRIWLVFGSAVHAIIADNGGVDPAIDGLEIEQKFEVPIGDCTLVGKIDLYCRGSRELIDYKTTKVYSAKLMKEGDIEDSYLWQLNCYKWFKYIDAEKLTLECLIKDWNPQALIKDGVLPIERINVPILPRADVELGVQNMIIEHEKVHNDPSTARSCTKEEVWFNTNPRSKYCGRPIRCDNYCEVCKICPQYNSFLSLMEADNGAASNIYPRR